MKKIYLFVFLLLSIFNVSFMEAQVGINTTTPDPSSSLDIESTEGGMLIPRMSTTQRNAITDPAHSLLVYDTDLKQYYYNEGSTSTPNWKAILSDAAERDNYKLVKSTADLQDELVAGGGTSYQLSSNTLYEINGTVTIDFPINMNDAHLIGLDMGNDVLVNGTGSALFQSTSAGGNLRNLTLNGNSSPLFNISGNGTQRLVVENCVMSGASSIGSFSNMNTIFFNIVDFFNNADGVQASDISSYFYSLVYWEPSNSGTFQEISGTFDDIQFENGRIIADTGEIGFDVSANPVVTRSGVLMGFVFDGDGVKVNPYTNGTYSGFNFTEKWAINCPGLPKESDDAAIGNITLSSPVGSGVSTTFNGSGTSSRKKLDGTTSSTNLFRFTKVGNNRIQYQGLRTRYFQINGSMSYQATDDVTIILYVAKNGVVIENTKVYGRGPSGFFVNQGILALTIAGQIELSTDDYIEIWAERYSGSGNILTVSLNVNVF